LKENSNLIVVFHHRWALRFLETFFDNEEGYKEEDNLEYHSYLEPINTETKTSSLRERQQYIKEGLISQINKIINQGHKLVLVYPVPEVGVNHIDIYLRNIFLTKTYSKTQFLFFQVVTKFIKKETN
jgi:hypothetical protein